MRALSVKQPWAELIALGKKKIEFRTWQRDFRGNLLIVASKSRQDDECEEEGLDPTKLVYGAAVCIVDFWKVTGPDFDGQFSWHLRDPRRVEPFPVKGYASIYNVDDALIREVDGGSATAKKGTRATRAVVGPTKQEQEVRVAASRAKPEVQPRPKKKPPTFIR